MHQGARTQSSQQETAGSEVPPRPGAPPLQETGALPVPAPQPSDPAHLPTWGPGGCHLQRPRPVCSRGRRRPIPNSQRGAELQQPASPGQRPGPTGGRGRSAGSQSAQREGRPIGPGRGLAPTVNCPGLGRCLGGGAGEAGRLLGRAGLGVLVRPPPCWRPGRLNSGFLLHLQFI